jgi:prephenate dehydrogenase
VVVHRLCIVGLGMMGGAIGMAARRTGAAVRVVGVTHTQQTVETARVKGAVDEATLDLRAGVHDADLIVLCVPVRTILDAAAAVIPACRDGTIITDIGSSKGVIVREVEALIHSSKKQIHFVGSHPLTGSEKRGFGAAEEINLNGALCVLTPTQHTDIEAYRKVEEFWKALGLKTMRLAPDEHDVVLARSSHLPHVVSAAIIGAQTDRSLDVSGPGLRDMARLSGGEPALWTDILEQNAHEISKAVKEMGQKLIELASEIELLTARGTPGSEAARERLFRFLADARQRHDKRYVEVKKITPPAETVDTEENGKEEVPPER